MVGIDRNTRKLISNADAVRQNIEMALKIPQGTIMFQRGSGYAALTPDGAPRPGMGRQYYQSTALAALRNLPISGTTVEAEVDDQQNLTRLLVKYEFGGTLDKASVTY